MYNKMVWLENDDFKAEVQQFEGQVYLHCEVYNFSKSVLEKIREEFYKVAELTYQRGLTHMFSYTSNLKFTNLIAPCEVIGEVSERGTTLKVIAWEL